MEVPKWLSSNEGRAVFKKCRGIVPDSLWASSFEPIVTPEEVKRFRRELDDYLAERQSAFGETASNTLGDLPEDAA